MEKVQLSLERFLPELRDLGRRKIFNDEEISDIVRQRRGFELSLASRDVKPADYLRYIEYETRLEKLRKLRASRIKITTKKTLSDHSIAAHITHLHRLSTRRFPSSIPMWDAFLAHALSQSSPLLVSRTLSSAIAMHPTHVEYWLMASRWESEGDEKGMGGGNEEAARRLCMRGLRFLKGKTEDEGKIWKEWIRLECAFAERLRARWAVLGIGKLGKGGEEEIVRVGEKDKMDVEEEEEAVIDLPAIEGEDEEDSEVKKEVEKQQLSGQEAIIDGAIARVVIDNALASFKHSLPAYTMLITYLRTLPSSLRMSLLAHVHASLSTRFPSTDSSYPAALRLLATRGLYDVPFDPKQPKLPTDEQVASGEVLAEGEKLVDALGDATAIWWKAVKGGKGKGKDKATDKKQSADVKVELWEAFCEWLEEMSEEIDDEETEDLHTFVLSNLATALASAPASPFLSLLHLRHLLRSSAPPATVLALARRSTTLFGIPSATNAVSQEVAEQIWVARVETAVSLAAEVEADEIEQTFSAAFKRLPFSGRLWDVRCTYIEGLPSAAPDSTIAFYESSIPLVLLSSAKPPVNFRSTFASEVLEPRELVPRRYLAFLATEKDEKEVRSKVEKLLKTAPTLSLEFLVFVLEVVSDSLGFISTSSTGGRSKEERAFRTAVWERITSHPEAGADEWASYAEEMLKSGEVEKSADVVRRASRVLKGAEKARFDKRWGEICDQ